MVPVGRKVTMCFPIEVQSVFSLQVHSQLTFNFAAIFSRAFSVGLGHVSTVTTLQSDPHSFSVYAVEYSVTSYSFSSDSDFYEVE